MAAAVLSLGGAWWLRSAQESRTEASARMAAPPTLELGVAPSPAAEPRRSDAGLFPASGERLTLQVFGAGHSIEGAEVSLFVRDGLSPGSGEISWRSAGLDFPAPP